MDNQKSEIEHEVEQKLRENIRELILAKMQEGQSVTEQELEEMTATGNIAGYLTPGAFVGDKHSNKEHMKRIAQRIGYSLTKRGEKDAGPGDRLTEGAYHEYRNDPTKKPHQKIGMAISEINRQFKLVERALRMNARLQQECGVTDDKLWKRTRSQMVRLEGKLTELATSIRQMRS